MKRKILKSLIVVLVLALACIYTLPACSQIDKRGDVESDNASFYFDEESILSQLKAQNIDDINKDLIKRIDEEKLSGSVNVIITLSDGSLVNLYNQTDKSVELDQYLADGESRAIDQRARQRQSALEAQLVKEGLISPAKYHYSNILDGFSANTTYENLSKLVNHEGVYRVIIGNTYLPQATVVNDVNVFDTGIFNSENEAGYTGKHTVVAVLDTGCDYAHPAFTTHAVQDPRYSRDDIERLLPDTIAYREQNGLEAREVYFGNLTNNKIVFGYDYADKDTDIMPFLSEHGTHVAGIIGGYANDKIFDVNDEFDGDVNTTLHGVAIDTQLAIMKVFSDAREGAEDEDILAALEDCVALKVDAINMSLGSSCGFTREGIDDEYKNEIYDSIEEAGISLIVAASNDYSSAQGSEFGNTNKVENPDSGTVGAPSTYTSALSVASVNGNKDKFIHSGNKDIFFIEAYNQNSKEYDFFEMLGVTDDQDHEFEYVTVPGFGSQISYMGLDVRGKIALVKRGDINFEDKVLFAEAEGAIGVIIYNNVYGDILMTVGNNCHIGVASIGKDEGEYLASKPSGTLRLNAKDTAGPFMSDFSSWGPNPDLTIKPEITAHGGNIWSAIPGGGYEKMSGTSMASPNMCGIAVLVREYVNDKFPDETVQHKRDIVNQLLMSTATIAVNKEGNPYSPRKQGAGIADILSAISTPAYIVTYKNDLLNHRYETDENGNKIVMSTSKLELGDDPNRTGEYTMTFSVKNISKQSVSYKLGNYSFTESVSADKKYVAEKAYMLAHNTQYQVDGKAPAGDIITVPAQSSVEVTVKITLSKQDKTYLNDTFPNGMYVEGFITLDNQSTAQDSVDLNVPFLAFYGDWQDAPIFDKDYYEVETTAHNNAIDDEDKIKADYFATTPYALYYYDYIIPMGTYIYDLPYGYNPIPATEEHAALSYMPTNLSGLYAVYAGLLRCAKQLDVEIINASTGEVVWNKTEWNCYKAHYSGGARPYVYEFEEFGLPMFDFDKLTVDNTGAIDGAFGYNNDRFIVNMSARLDWGAEGDRNVRDTYSFSFYIDTEAPTVVGTNFRTKYNQSTRKTEYYLDLEVYDNHYAMDVRPLVITWAMDENGNHKTFHNSSTNTDEWMISLDTLSERTIPVYQTSRGTTTKVEIEITDYMDRIGDSLLPNTIMFQVEDYALNSNIVVIPLPETENENLVFGQYQKSENGNVETLNPIDHIDIDIGQMLDLTDYIVGNTPEINSNVNRDYLFMLEWSTDDKDGSVLQVNDGVVEGLATGSKTVSFVSGGQTHSITVNVSDKVYDGVVGRDDDKNRTDATLEEITFSSYFTMRAFNGDIDFSDIGEPGAHNYFEKSAAYVSFYPSEQIKLVYEIKPWNLAQQQIVYKTDENGNYLGADGNPITVKNDNGTLRYIDGKSAQDRVVEKQGRYEVEWSTSDPRVAVVDNNGYVTAVAEGICSITLRIRIDGKVSPLVARCDINVKSEFVIESGYLIAYKGMGKDYKGESPAALLASGKDIVVEIPDDEGLVYINSYAFAYFDLDNSMDVPDDDRYDIDIKKTPLGNPWISEVIVPNYITNIANYAFYSCTNLKKVTLGEKVTQIGKYAFYGDDKLASINLDNVNMINDYAFYGCTALSDVGANKLAHPYALGESTFEGCTALKELTLTNLRRGGRNAFKGCTGLTTLTFGEVTRLSEGMFANCEKLNMRPLKVNSDIVPDTAFSGCSSLTQVEFTKDITYFGTRAFENCTRLETVKFDGTCEQFATNAFANCRSIRNFTIGKFAVENGVVYNADKTELLFVVPNLFNQTTFILPASVQRIGAGAFSGTGITSFTTQVGSHLTYIGSNAFAGCRSLTQVQLPQSVTTIGSNAFAESGLSNIDLSSLALTEIAAETFRGCVNLTTVTLPAQCTVVGNNAFESCTSLTTVNGLENVREIGDSAFYLAGLRTATLGDVVIGEYAFAGAYRIARDPNTFEYYVVLGTPSALTTVRFNGKTVVGNYAFANTSLTSLTINTDGSEIHDYAFYGCTKLAEAVIEGVNGALGKYSFAGCYSESGNSGLTSITMNHVKEIGDSAFYETPTLETVESNELEKIGNEVFYPVLDEQGYITPCHITDIDTANVTEIGNYAFYYCVALPSVNLNNVTHIGDYAFTGCQTLSSVTAPKVTEIGKGAFSGCIALTSVSAPKLEVLGSQVFTRTAVTNFVLTDNIKQIGDAVTYAATQFEGFLYDNNGTQVRNAQREHFVIDDGVLYSVNANGGYTLVSYPQKRLPKADGSGEKDNYTVLEGTTRIGFRAAVGNTYIQTLTLPSTLLSIGDYAFYDCTKLSKVIFRSYYAPRLEGVSNLLEEILADPSRVDPDAPSYTTKDLPYFDDLYRYDFYFHFDEIGEISYGYDNIYDYRHFVNSVGHSKLTMQIPVNSSGYDSLIYRVYFNEAPVKGEETMGRYAIDFIDAVKQLQQLDKIDRFAEKQINAATVAYNMLMANKGDLKYVDSSYQTFYTDALKAYNVDLARHALESLLPMADNRSSYDMLTEANTLYNALSGEEKAMLDTALGTSAKTLLDNKIAEYKAATNNRKLDLNQPWAERVLDRLAEIVGTMVSDFNPTTYNSWNSDDRFEYWRNNVTVEDYTTIKQINALVKTLDKNERERYISRLTPYLDVIDIWNGYADISRTLSKAQTVAKATSPNAVVATAVTLNALLAVAYVVLKGGIL